MKKNMIRCLIIGILILGACRSNERVVNHPGMICFSGGLNVAIDSVVLNDTATIFSITLGTAWSREFTLDSGASVVVNGEKYMLRGAKGIEPGKEISIEAHSDRGFDLIFPVIPHAADQVDLMLSEGQHGTKIWGIVLNDRKVPVKEQIPGKVRNRKMDMGKEWVSPGLTSGKSRLTLHVLGFKPGMEEKVSIQLISVIPAYLNGKIDQDGVAHFEFDQYGTSPVRINYQGVILENILITPGEEVHVYVDLYACTENRMPANQEKRQEPSFYITGHYADLNHVLLNKSKKSWNVNTLPSAEKMPEMNKERYLANCLLDYQTSLRCIEEDTTISGETRSYLKLDRQVAFLNRARQMEQDLTKAYLVKHNLKTIPYKEVGKLKEKGILPALNPGDLAIAKTFSVNTYDVMCIPEQNAIFFGPKWTREDLKKFWGAEKGYLFDRLLVGECMGAIRDKNALTEAQKKELRERSVFWEKSVLSFNEQLVRELDSVKNQKDYRVCPVPDVPDERLFEAILENYKGKVVFVDYWATWCSPCCDAMKTMLPAKEKFKGKDIAYVFITGETSPLHRWEYMIPEIKGDHYRLNDRQWKYLRKRFDITGIPSYHVISKKGEIKYFCIAFMGVEKMSELLEQEI